MLNRYVIALNHIKIEEKASAMKPGAFENGKISIVEVNKLMNFVRKYPIDQIDRKKLFTCGFSKN